MWFVYIHVVWFILWLRAEPFKDVFPYGLLTMIVSLEAIFLSTFVMISQNRADEKRQALADHQWEMIQLEEKQNEQLLRISEKLLTLTTEVHALTGEVHQVMKQAGPGQAGSFSVVDRPSRGLLGHAQLWRPSGTSRWPTLRGPERITSICSVRAQWASRLSACDGVRHVDASRRAHRAHGVRSPNTATTCRRCATGH